LDKGEDFATLVKQYSNDGQPNIDNGGLYADANVSEWVPEFKEAAMTLPLNKISDPVETQFGYHIIRVESRTEKTLADLTEEQKDALKRSVASEKVDEYIYGDNSKKIIKEITLPKVENKTDANNGANSGKDNNGSADNADKSGNSSNSGNSEATNGNNTDAAKGGK
jgi:foldase protein PrsA